jgi:4-diphosphocytidyl-2-C-methyl-D-erythritol kinase
MPNRRLLRAQAFAKINLSLRVLRRRADGYHELRTIFQSIALHDTLTVHAARGPFRLECDDPGCPADRKNLVWRAAERVWKAAGRSGPPRGLVMRLEKRIPIAAGLGGGSSDAAATLRALGRLWRVAEPRLRTIGASLGADVPYFFEGGTVLGLERGDLLFPLLDRPRAWVVLVLPSFPVSTAEAYLWWDRDRKRGRSPGTIGRAVHLCGDGLSNDLEPPVATRHPDIARIVTALRRTGASHAAMSGSGSSVFGLFERRIAAAGAAAAVATRGRRVLITRTVARAEYRALAAK